MDLIVLNVLLLGIVSLCVVIFRHIFFDRQYFKNQGIPGSRPIPFFGTLWHIWGKNAHEVVLEDYKKYGKLFGTYMGSIPCLNVADPKLIKAILLEDYQNFYGRKERAVNSRKSSSTYELASLPAGAKWKAIRSIISASLGPTVIKQNMPLLNEIGDKLVTRFKQLSQSDGKLNIQIECSCWSLEVISKLLFSLNENIIGNPIHEFINNAGGELRGHIEGISSTIAYLKPDLANLCKSLSQPKLSGQAYFLKLGEKLFYEREKNNGGDPTTLRSGGDMLDNLMTTLKTRSWTNSKLSAEEDRLKLSVAQFAATPIGTHEAASSVSRLLHCLAMNPEIQEKARLEVMESLRENDGIVSFNMIHKLPYLEQCMNESMRLYPTLYRITRAVNEDKQYDNVFFKTGAVVRIPTYALNRDPDNYPNPEKFDPERFNPVQLNQRDPNIFLPFGAGPRDCPARRFIMPIMKLILCHVLLNFKLYPVEETINPLQCTSGFPGSMAVKDKMWLGIETMK